jgi:hypothetical protein
MSDDPIVARVIAKHAERSKRGVTKYGVTLDRVDLTRLDWLRHLSEELLDAACYCERLIRDEEVREYREFIAASQADMQAEVDSFELAVARNVARDALARRGGEGGGE